VSNHLAHDVVLPKRTIELSAEERLSARALARGMPRSTGARAARQQRLAAIPWPGTTHARAMPWPI